MKKPRGGLSLMPDTVETTLLLAVGGGLVVDGAWGS